MEYNEIINSIKCHIESANQLILGLLADEKYNFNGELNEFLKSGKKIRSALMFLVLKSLNYDITKSHLALANAVELMHNASLVHDDIIDKAKTRRKDMSFNEKYGNSISVIIGDYLFALSCEYINSIHNESITKTFTNTMKTMCQGEIEQYFAKGHVCSINEYIEKSYKKTGILFETAIKSILITENINNDSIIEFAKNFGIAFQLKDDFNNIYKGIYTDIDDKIYTASIIYAAEDYSNILAYNKEKIIDIVKNEKYKNKTQKLIEEYIKKAIENVNSLQDNKYKEALMNLCKYIEKG